jgi:hypothetical protein
MFLAFSSTLVALSVLDGAGVSMALTGADADETVCTTGGTTGS